MISASVIYREINDVVSAVCCLHGVGNELVTHLVGWHGDLHCLSASVGQIDGDAYSGVWY